MELLGFPPPPRKTCWTREAAVDTPDYQAAWKEDAHESEQVWSTLGTFVIDQGHAEAYLKVPTALDDEDGTVNVHASQASYLKLKKHLVNVELNVVLSQTMVLLIENYWLFFSLNLV